MANTAQENEHLNIGLSLLMSSKYGEYIKANTDHATFFEQYKRLGRNCFDTWFKFQDSSAFLVSRQSNPFSNSRSKASNCTACAITVRSAKSLMNPAIHEQQIYFNRAHADQTTIVHELLHFFTHRKFDAFVNSGINEAVTEYFTRKILSNVGDKTKAKGFDIGARANRYDKEHAAIMQFHAQAKTDLPSEDDYFKRAYFGGDQTCMELISISAIK